MALSSDPYEQKLYHMFQAHSSPGNGVLDRDALVKLCHTLELKERGHLLVKCLMTGSKTHVSFREFREGLLHILGGNDGSSSQQPAGTGDLDAAATSPSTRSREAYEESGEAMRHSKPGISIKLPSLVGCNLGLTLNSRSVALLAGIVLHCSRLSAQGQENKNTNRGEGRDLITKRP